MPKKFIITFALTLSGILGILGLAPQPDLGAQPIMPRKREFPLTLHNPVEAVKWAVADIQTEPDEETRKYVRYLSLYNIHPDDRDAYIATIDFALNSLNGGKYGGQKRILTRVGVIPGTDKTLLKVRLDFYCLDPKDWDDLGRKGSGPIVSVKKIDQPDPYFHIQMKKRITERIRKVRKVQEWDPRGFNVTKEREYFVEGETVNKIELAHAPWIPGKDIVSLAVAAETDFPILRGDWFLANAMINPAYAQFLGVKSIKDIQRIARFHEEDVDLAEKGVVTESQEVALHMRAMKRTPTASGYYWETFDYFTSIDENDLLADLLKDRRDAGEIIFTLPNGLQGYALVNDVDKLIDFADPNVAADTQTPWRNKLVWTSVSCITCHTRGIKAINEEVRLLARPNVALLIKKRKDFESIVQLFSAPIDDTITKDQTVYMRAVTLATGGLTAELNAANVQRFFVGYLQKSITVQDAAMEVGVPPDKILRMIERLEQPDHTLTQIYARRPVRRDQWEATGFGQMMTLPFESLK